MGSFFGDLSKLFAELNLTESDCQHLQSLHDVTVKKIIKCSSFQQSFAKLSDYEDRVRFFIGQEPFQKFIVYLTEHCKSIRSEGKNVARAEKFRLEGNQAFGKQRFKEALTLYNDAIRYAPKESEELPLAYSNRSVVFFHIGQYEDALKDIETALAHDYAQYKPVIKLNIRKSECLIRLGRTVEAKEMIDVLESKDTKSPDAIRLAELRQLIDSLLSVKDRNYAPDGNKDASRASKFREDGNKAFVDCRLLDAVALYTQAIQYAPMHILTTLTSSTNDLKVLEELPLAYGNRSAVFYHLEQYENALKDIENAFFLGYCLIKPVNKLMLRKCECLLKLGRAEEAKETIDSIDTEDMDASDEARWSELTSQLVDKNLKASKLDDNGKSKLRNVVSVVKTLTEKDRFQPQSKFSSLSTKVAIRYDSENGRHLVATEDIQFGDILAVTEPNAFILYPNQEGHFCHHCLLPLTSKLAIGLTEPKKLSRLVPCEQCPHVLYCSEQCRAESWSSYHRSECSLLPVLHLFDRDDRRNNHLALRALLSTGLNTIRKVIQKFEDNNKDPFTSTEFTDPVDYEHVYQMKTKSNLLLVNLQTVDIIWQTFFAYLMVKLAKIADERFFVNFDAVFDNPSNEDEQEDEIFISSLLLRHFIQIHSNYFIKVKSSPIPEFPGSPLRPNSMNKELFQTLHPLMGLLKNSCDPNISITSVDRDGDGQQSNVVAFFAIRPFTAGSKLTASLPGYGGGQDCRFLMHHQAKYQARRLTEMFGADCPCDECVLQRRDNPHQTGEKKRKYYPIGCPDCHGLLTRESASDIIYHCLDCSKTISITEVTNVYTIMESFDAAAQMYISLVEKDMQEKRRPQMLAQLDDLVSEHIPGLVHRGSLLLAEQYEKLFHTHLGLSPNLEHFHQEFRDAWKYANAMVTTLEHHYGQTSLPVLVQLMEILHCFQVVVTSKSFGNLLKEEKLLDGEKHDEEQQWLDRLQVVSERVKLMKNLYNFA